MSTLWEGIREALLDALIPARRPAEYWAAQAERERRIQWDYAAQTNAYYARRAEDARVRYLMNPASQQAPPTDWYG